MHILPALSLGLFLAPAAFASAGKSYEISWGKPGVSYAQYRKDAIECGHDAWYEDVSGTDAAKVFKRASSELEDSEYSPDMAPPTRREAAQEFAIEQAGRSARIVAATRPEKRFAEVRTLQYDVLGKCLSDRGYVQFRLTEVQHRQLRKLRIGSPERHRFLYQLGSNGRVIAAQRI